MSWINAVLKDAQLILVLLSIMTTVPVKCHACLPTGVSVAYQIKDVDKQVELDASFTFSCQAEMIIFELSLRSVS